MAGAGRRLPCFMFLTRSRVSFARDHDRHAFQAGLQARSLGLAGDG